MSDVFRLKQDGGLAVIVLRHDVGSLADFDVLTEVEALLERLDPSGIGGVIVDFGRVEYFGSSLLEALLRIWHHVHPAGKRMVLCNVKPVGREVLEVSKFNTLWPICGSREEASEEVRRAPPPGAES